MSSGLFSPIRLRGLELDNRLVISPMCQYSAEDGVANTWHLVHLSSMAMSGAALVIAEATAVEAVGRITPGCLGLYTDEQEAALAHICREVGKIANAKLGIQLAHAGRRASCRTTFERWRGEVLSPEEGAWTPVGPSAIAYDQGWPTPEALDIQGLERVRKAFVESALRAVRAGFALIEIHAAHGYLLHNFISPITNQRDDAYGGDANRRMRFPLEVAQAVRAAVPAHIPVGVRVNSTDWHEGAMTLDDAVVFAAHLKEAGIDYACMSAGNLAPFVRIPTATPGHQVPFAERVKHETGLATMAVGFITDPHQADDIITEDRADMVAIARAAMDNPRWGWHAAAALGQDIVYPKQYLRAKPNNWLGYKVVHPESTVIGGVQADRPKASEWDRVPRQ